MLNVLLMLTVAGLVILLAKIRAARHEREAREYHAQLEAQRAERRKARQRDHDQMRADLIRAHGHIAAQIGARVGRSVAARPKSVSRATPASASDPMDLLNPLNPISPISVYSYGTPDTSCDTSSSYDSGSSSDSSCSSDSGSW